jgi:hypothetical protein
MSKNGERLLSLAQEFVDNLKPSNNSFLESGTTTQPVLARNPYIANVSCSHFIRLGLEQTVDHKRSEWKEIFGSSTPQAFRYFDAYASGPLKAHRAMSISEVRPGDLGFIKYDVVRPGATGHCFIVASTPKPTGEPYGGIDAYRIDVIDSSRTSHGTGDTRRVAESDGSPRDLGGVGRGSIRLLCRDGEIIGYTWSGHTNSELLMNGKGQNILIGEVPDSWPLRPA